jgi:hypothetical protein
VELGRGGDDEGRAGLGLHGVVSMACMVAALRFQCSV